MIKFKVKEIAANFDVKSKKITEILEENCGVSKKSAASLETEELNMIFDVMTQENAVEDLSAYFAVRDKAIEKMEQEALEEVVEDKPKSKAIPVEIEVEEKPAQKAKKNDKKSVGKKKEPEKMVNTITEEYSDHRSNRRVIDTRQSNVDVEKYNQKYDDMANDKLRRNQDTSKKQKFTNRAQKQKARRGGKRETEQQRLARIEKQRKERVLTITVPDEIVVSELASRLKATVAEVVKKAFLMGSMITANDVIDFDTAEVIALEFNAKVEKEVVVTIEEQIIDDSEDDDTNLVERAPVVVVMGHVDHGKTSILDAIRHANVTEGEAGGITQHIGAYRVQINDRPITFLDTPGHEAFTTMRARGAQATDIAILVVAADDGIMPQTVEAINHAKAAGVSVVVAINKMDKEGANPDRVMQQLTEYELVPEEWGGDVICVPVSAKTKMGLDDLLENVLLVADMKELKANPDRQAKGIVIEA